MLGAEGQVYLDDYPVYATAAYRGGYYDATTQGDNGDEHMFMAGVNILFGPSTLKDNDRLGAALDLPRLPARAAPWGEGLNWFWPSWKTSDSQLRNQTRSVLSDRSRAPTVPPEPLSFKLMVSVADLSPDLIFSFRMPILAPSVKELPLWIFSIVSGA